MITPSSEELIVLDLVPFGQTNSKSNFYALRLSHPTWKNWQPGQFVMVRPHSFGNELPWARPFGICHMTKQHLILFFQVVGRGTKRLAELTAGEKVQVWGPLGNGFAVYPNTPTLLLAGGMGIVPFIGYVHQHPTPWNLCMLFGHRQPLSCYPVESINERIPVDTLHETTPGDLENLLFCLQERIHDCAEQQGLVLACGPLPFLRTVQSYCKESGAKAQLSLENRMACGVGACLGCVTKIPAETADCKSEKFERVCTKGPVFWADQVLL